MPAGTSRDDGDDRTGGGRLPAGPAGPLPPLRGQLPERPGSGPRRQRPDRHRRERRAARARQGGDRDGALQPAFAGARRHRQRRGRGRPAPPLGRDVRAHAVARPARRGDARDRRARHRHLGPLRPFAGSPGLRSARGAASRAPARLRHGLSPGGRARAHRRPGRAAAGPRLPPPQGLRRALVGGAGAGAAEPHPPARAGGAGARA